MTRKNRVIIALIITLLICCPGNVFAGDPFSKLCRGIVNIGTSPLSFFNQYSRIAANRDPFVAIFEGLCYGMAGTLERLVVGAYEVVTFPVPVPPNYESVIQPATPLVELSKMQK